MIYHTQEKELSATTAPFLIIQPGIILNRLLAVSLTQQENDIKRDFSGGSSFPKSFRAYSLAVRIGRITSFTDKFRPFFTYRLYTKLVYS